jgi:hypothetical protein
VILHRYVSQNSAAKELKVDRVSVRKCLDSAIDDVCGYEFRRAGGGEGVKKVETKETKEVLFQAQMTKEMMKGVKKGVKTTEAKKTGGKGKVAKDMEDTEEGGDEGEGEEDEEDEEDEEEGGQKGKEGKPGQALPRRTHGMFTKESTSGAGGRSGKNHVGAAAAVEAAAATTRKSGVKSGGKGGTGGKAPAKRTWAAAGLFGGGLIMSRRKRGR